TAILIDEDCYVIRIARDIPSINVPVITGVNVVTFTTGSRLGASKTRQIEDISNILTALIDWGVLETFSEVNLSQFDDVYLVTRGGMIVVLGDTSGLDDKIMWTKNVLDELAASGVSKGEIDVSSGKMAVYSPES
ncbi:MAG: hypothetical protein Q4D04_12640, partial [Clostridia bacterium]|nr:hypothetical protein [Clostridia bacterium]